jgi:hypothetical protein
MTFEVETAEVQEQNARIAVTVRDARFVFAGDATGANVACSIAVAATAVGRELEARAVLRLALWRRGAGAVDTLARAVAIRAILLVDALAALTRLAEAVAAVNAVVVGAGSALTRLALIVLTDTAVDRGAGLPVDALLALRAGRRTLLNRRLTLLFLLFVLLLVLPLGAGRSGTKGKWE